MEIKVLENGKDWLYLNSKDSNEIKTWKIDGGFIWKAKKNEIHNSSTKGHCTHVQRGKKKKKNRGKTCSEPKAPQQHPLQPLSLSILSEISAVGYILLHCKNSNAYDFMTMPYHHNSVKCYHSILLFVVFVRVFGR